MPNNSVGTTLHKDRSACSKKYYLPGVLIMRDLLVAAVIFGAIPLILWRPYIGVLVWSLIGYMNPHRLTYGWAYDFPFAQVIAIVTLVAIVFSTEPKRIPFLPIVKVWVLFILWMNVTTYFALEPAVAIQEWDRMLKVQLISFITLMLITNRERLDLLVWTIAISLGFYGLKGGVFSILTGGQYLVFGPDLSFIEDNNDLALALVMILPLMRYLHLEATKRYLKWGLLIAMGLTALSILTSHSRGALLAISAMGVFMLLKSPYKLRAILVTVILLPIMLSFMPDAWFDRM
ncbi:MAG TPA: putative O-glycosylation ligase, exosortase A system-associated, partial [Acidiferrobacteraceae bacterium]|nr:putative O-glycosylation ligase, exosortase A system-associated [Acidiferrobacteraceae bacterium]HEX19449.1 putative O-glycosylation ligase, exosortase A system-associated [Acidiferrobacteraceae bacterium]